MAQHRSLAARSCLRTASVAALVLVCGVATGQDQSPIMPIQEPKPEPRRPAVDNWTLPELEQSPEWIRTARVLPEGTFLVSQTGAMLQAPTGEWVFVPASGDEGTLPAMVMVPGRVLARMETAFGTAGEATTPLFEVNGQVMLYAGRNYLLVNSFTPIDDEPAQVQDQDQDPSSEDGTQPPTSGSDPSVNPSLQLLLDDLERSRSEGRRGLVGGSDQGDAEQAPIPEGTLLTKRRARLVRLPGSEWAAAFDSGLDQPDQGELIIVPCAALQRMENIAARRREELTFELSGRVLDYQGTSYVVPTVLRLYPIGSLDPLQ